MWTRKLIGLSVCGLLLWAGAAPAVAQTTVHADLVEQNHTGVHGSVTLTATGAGDLHVKIRANGLLPGPHAQHIHGASGAGHFECATDRDDADGDGWLSNEEASGEYGDVFVALTTKGDTGPESGLDLARMPVADADGRLTYDRTIPADQLPEGLLAHLDGVHVVQHGVDANSNGAYDLKGLGESTFAAGLGIQNVPEEATDPAACGMLVGVGLRQAPTGGVETGGGDPRLPRLALLGPALVLLATILVTRRRSRSLDG
jgi:Cu/Zn superoxide dismutase